MIIFISYAFVWTSDPHGLSLMIHRNTSRILSANTQ
jgi:hypothetical protein